MRAIIIESKESPAQLTEVDESELLTGDVGINILYSSYNYKDGLALAGKGILRRWPLIPGIDLVGGVTDSASPHWRAGDLVILNGDGLGETQHGGFAEKARVSSDALVRLPDPISAVQAAAIGTAGFTAMLSVLRLEDAGTTPDDGEILVTGAAGGVGSVAITLLATRGFQVVASSGRAESEAEYFKELGASRVIDRREFSETLGGPLQSQRWAGAIDSVGSTTLANVLAQTAHGKTVASCGLAQGSDLPTTVMPFILRGVTLAGVNSVLAPKELRERAWKALAAELDLAQLDALSQTIGLSETIPYAQEILQGRVRGRTVVDVKA